MIKYLDLLCDLLNVESDEKQSILAVGESLIQYKDKKLIIHHRLGFLFEGFWDLIHDQISLEEFMVLGDVSSPHLLCPPDRGEGRGVNSVSSLEFLQSSKALEKLGQGSMLIVDEISFLTFSNLEQEEVKKLLEQREVILLMC